VPINFTGLPPDSEIRIKLTQPDDGLILLTVAGAIDLSTRDQFGVRLNDVIDSTDDTVVIVVDLSGVEFLGLAGVRALLEAQAQIEPADRLRVVTGTLAAYRVLHVTGLATRFQTFVSVDAALNDERTASAS
jgi:anti-anti-sigma factor